MKANYRRFIDRLINRYEGNYSWDRNDRGGPTKYGITCYDLAEHRGLKMTSMAHWAPIVKAMGLPEAETIYAEKYAGAVHFDDLPNGIDACMMDYEVNSGVRAIRVACALFGLPASSKMTPALLDALKRASPRSFINRMCDERLHFMQSIRGGKDWERYHKGWSDRVADLRKYSLALVDNKTIPDPAPIDKHIKAEHPAPDAGTHTKVTGAVATVGAATAHVGAQTHWITVAVIAAFAVAGLAVYMWRQHKAKKANETVVLPPSALPPEGVAPVEDQTLFERFVASFHDSETILWARIKMVLGATALLIQQSGADLSIILSPKEMVIYQIVSAFLLAEGGFSEMIRRRKAEDLK